MIPFICDSRKRPLSFQSKMDADLRREYLRCLHFREAGFPERSPTRNVVTHKTYRPDPVTVRSAAGTKTTTVNMQKAAPLENDFYSLGEFSLKAGEPVSVIISTEDAGGNAHADALQVLPVK